MCLPSAEGQKDISHDEGAHVTLHISLLKPYLVYYHIKQAVEEDVALCSTFLHYNTKTLYISAADKHTVEDSTTIEYSDETKFFPPDK